MNEKINPAWHQWLCTTAFEKHDCSWLDSIV